MSAFEPHDPGFAEGELLPGTHVNAKKGVAMLVPEADFILAYGCRLPEGFAAYAYIPRGEVAAKGVVDAMKISHLSSAGGRRTAARNIKYKAYYDDIIPTLDRDSHVMGLVRGEMIRLRPKRIGHTHHTAQTHRLRAGQVYAVVGTIPFGMRGFPPETVAGDVMKIFSTTSKGGVSAYFPRLDKKWRIHQYPQGEIITSHLMLVRNTPVPARETAARWAREDWWEGNREDLNLLGKRPVRLSYKDSRVRVKDTGSWRSRSDVYKKFYAIPKGK